MSKSADTAAELRKWKEKFFDLQESYDGDKKGFAEYQSILQRLLLRVCLSAEGQSAAFDKELKNLRDDIKSPSLTTDVLSKRLAKIDKALVKVDDVKSVFVASFIRLFDEIIEQLLSTKPARSERASLKKLAKSVSIAGFSNEQIIPLMTEYQHLQAKVLSQLDEPQSKSPGLMGRLFKSVSKTQDDRLGGSAQEEGIELESSEQVEEDDVIPGFSAISVHVRATLNHLLDQLTFPKSSERALASLRTRLDGPLNWYELGPTLDDLSNVIISAIGKGQRDFGSFLTDIDEQLQKIQQFVLESLKADESLRQEEKELDQQMRAQIMNMTDSLESDSDVESLKRSIREQVENISKVLDRFSETGKQLEQNKASELELMKQRFEALENETKFFRERLKEERGKALTDALTQLPNREAYDERVTMELERWRRYRKPATLIVADIDHFKSINDNYGHLSGDKVLQILAKEVQARLRKSDFVARYGGEEFVMILPEADAEIAKTVVNKMRTTIERLPFHFRDEKVQVTVSFGIAEFADGVDHEGLFDRADKALYQAKEAGRNCLFVWQG
jgi:diguanylate cyclase